MNNIKCFIFDFDDTIVYSENMKIKEFYNISQKYNSFGINFYNENINKRLSRFQYFEKLSNKIVNNTLLQQNDSKILYYSMLEEFSKNVSNNLKKCKEVDNIEPFLKILHSKNYKIFISSKSNTEDIINTLKHKDLIKYFDGVYGLEQSKIKHFEQIMKENNFINEQLCFFGDSYTDYEVAKHFNCEFIGILTERDDLKNANCLKINDYNKIIELL